MDRCAVQGRANVLADKGAVARKLLDLAIKINLRIGQLPPPFGGIDEQRANTAIDIDQMVTLGRAGGKAQVIERLLVFAQVLRQRLEHLGAIMKRQRPQRRSPAPAGIVEHGCNGQGACPGLCHDCAGNGVLNRSRAAIGRDPLSSGVTFDIEHA